MDDKKLKMMMLLLVKKAKAKVLCVVKVIVCYEFEDDVKWWLCALFSHWNTLLFLYAFVLSLTIFKFQPCLFQNPPTFLRSEIRFLCVQLGFLWVPKGERGLTINFWKMKQRICCSVVDLHRNKKVFKRKRGKR